MKNCNLSVFGAILRLIVAFSFISYGLIQSNYIVLVIGLIPLVRVSYYYFYLKLPD